MTGRQEQQERFQHEFSYQEDKHDAGQELGEEYPVEFSPKLKNFKGRVTRPFRSPTNKRKAEL